MSIEQHRLRLKADGAAGPDGQFEILAITAGNGNGWEFSPRVLRESLACWEGAECFIDHAGFGRSLRDLAGICQSPQWDEARRGIRLKLSPLGPSGPLLAELGRQMLGEEPRPRVGFSADVVFTALGRAVQTVLKVHSVDLVFDPARGGAFLRALNSTTYQGASCMEKFLSNPSAPEGQPEPLERAALTAGNPAAGAEDARREICGYLLESALAAANLPQPAAERLRRQFDGQVFTPAALREAVQDSRRMVSELTAGQAVRGPRVSEMVSSGDQITAAIHDLLGAERPKGIGGVRPARLSGIRELYLLMTGDDEFAGGYHPDRAQFAATTDLPGVLKNALNKLVIQQWEELGRAGYRWWEPVVSIEHFNSLQALTGVLVGEVTLLPTVAEGGPYTELGVSDSPETGNWAKYGGYIGLTIEMFERDETHRLRQYPRKLASAGLRRVSSLVSAVFTANSGIGPAMADTYKVFDAVHHGNLGTTALASPSWETASSAIYNQSMVVASGGSAPKLALDAKYLLVPRALRLTGMQILYPNWERQANIFADNMQRGEMGDVITVPEWTDATDWAAAADPRLAPGIILAERFGVLPEIFIADNQLSGALFTNDEIRIKARHWLSVFVADYRPLYKANVAG